MKGDIFQSSKVKKMFETEQYTGIELEQFWKQGAAIGSRHHQHLKYIIREGQIQIIEQR